MPYQPDAQARESAEDPRLRVGLVSFFVRSPYGLSATVGEASLQWRSLSQPPRSALALPPFHALVKSAVSARAWQAGSACHFFASGWQALPWPQLPVSQLVVL